MKNRDLRGFKNLSGVRKRGKNAKATEMKTPHKSGGFCAG